MTSTINDPYGELALAVIAQAFTDKDKPLHRNEVAEFFTSDWCAQLCDVAGLDPSVIAKTLLNYSALRAKAAQAKALRAKAARPE